MCLCSIDVLSQWRSQTECSGLPKLLIKPAGPLSLGPPFVPNMVSFMLEYLCRGSTCSRRYSSCSSHQTTLKFSFASPVSISCTSRCMTLPYTTKSSEQTALCKFIFDECNAESARHIQLMTISARQKSHHSPHTIRLWQHLSKA